VTRAEIEKADWSLTPGRYVGISADVEDNDEVFGEQINEILCDLTVLKFEADSLFVSVKATLEELGQ
jgi:type I restriction enzyme M protein